MTVFCAILSVLRTKLLQNKVLQFLAEDRLEFKKYRS